MSTKFDCYTNRLKSKEIIKLFFFEIFSNPTIIIFTTDIAFSSICHKNITPNMSAIIIITHRIIRNDVCKSKPSNIHVTRNTALNDNDKLTIRLCHIVKY